LLGPGAAVFLSDACGALPQDAPFVRAS